MGSMLHHLYKIFRVIIMIAVCKGFHTVFKKQRLHSVARTTSLSANLHQDPMLVRAYNGEKVQRTPVWFMRQAGRYMEEFRRYSSKYSFRERSETADIAVELSLQPVRRFGVDGVIMFSDILTILPGLGVEFSIIEGKGPKILQPLRSIDDINTLRTISDMDKQYPFIAPIIKTLRKEVTSDTAVIGFVGAPWTLAGYMIEGGHSKNCRLFKTMCIDDPGTVHILLEKLTEAICIYASHQITSGAQVIQVFESWAHHLTEDQFTQFAKPYADKIAACLKRLHPSVPLIYYANGGSCFLSHQKSMLYDSLSIDWRINMMSARSTVGFEKVLAGNIDPLLLYCSKESIKAAVGKVAKESGNSKFVLNLGHGIDKDMPEENVEFMVNCCRSLPPPTKC